MENGLTKVRFDLWAVLGFLIIIVATGFGYLFTAQAENAKERQKENQAVCDRVTKLETQYYFITEGIKELREGQKDLVATIKRKAKNGNDL